MLLTCVCLSHPSPGQRQCGHTALLAWTCEAETGEGRLPESWNHLSRSQEGGSWLVASVPSALLSFFLSPRSYHPASPAGKTDK